MQAAALLLLLASAAAVEGGLTYVRWGRSDCNVTEGAVRVYSGFAAGSQFNHHGSGSNILCLPDEPEFDVQMGANGGRGFLYGMEYQFEADYYPNGPFSGENAGGQPLADRPAPCALCYVSTRLAEVMIPAKINCPAGWTKEYGGYLMSARYEDFYYKTSFNCWDRAPEIAAGDIQMDQALVYPVRVGCGTLPCANFQNWEATCVVCTR